MQQKRWRLEYQEEIIDYDNFQKVILDNRQLKMDDLSCENWFEELNEETLEIKIGETKKAIERILLAKEKHEKVLIFGDYDVDGNCATAIAWLGLKEIGIVAQPFIPHRLNHGYGMSLKALKEIFDKEKPDLIITVDNGITAADALNFCQDEGVEIIITDHHQPPKDALLPAIAVIQTTKLSGAGVSWWLIGQLLSTLQVTDWRKKWESLLDLMCLATIVDQVPLKGINRKITKVGLQKLRQTQRVGLLELFALKKIKADTLNTREIGFKIGPQINAVGRLTNTLESLRLLCTNNKIKARALAKSLGEINYTRQELTAEMLDLALKQIEPDNLAKVILVASDKYHEGIIGLIASKLVDLYSRPAIVIAINGEVAKGSVRSIEGFNVTDFLRYFREDFIDLGGHAVAAGFSIFTNKIAEVKEKITKRSGTMLREEDLQPTILADFNVRPSVLHDAQVRPLVEILEPFGAGNPNLILQTEGKVDSWRYLGDKDQHMKIDIVDEKNAHLQILFWAFEEKELIHPEKDQIIQVVGEFKIDEFRGKFSPVLVGIDYRVKGDSLTSNEGTDLFQDEVSK